MDEFSNKDLLYSNLLGLTRSWSRTLIHNNLYLFLFLRIFNSFWIRIYHKSITHRLRLILHLDTSMHMHSVVEWWRNKGKFSIRCFRWRLWLVFKRCLVMFCNMPLKIVEDNFYCGNTQDQLWRLGIFFFFCCFGRHIDLMWKFRRFGTFSVELCLFFSLSQFPRWKH